MNEILFLLFAFFTVFLSIRLSYYVNYLNKTTKVSSAFLGGILLAGVTSLPELVTCFSAILVKNELLAMGDVLGSNIFNVFMISLFDLFFTKKKIFFSCDKTNKLILVLLLVNYLFLYCFINIKYFDFRVGVPSLIIFFTYFYYLFYVSNKESNEVIINDNNCDNVVVKLIITAVLMVFSSVILTVIVNKLSYMHPYFSSSFLGAIFLGITTSLPEVVTCYTLISMDNYNLAIADIIGSNFFNLLVLALGDLFVVGNIYSFSDSGLVTLVILGLMFTLLIYVNNNKSIKYERLYGIISFLIVVSYLCYWITNFLG